jgi:hypothetical protein
MINGRLCRAAPLRGRPYCFAHRLRLGADATVTVRELYRLAEEFDQRSREAGELYPAVEFVEWLKPELAETG